MGIRMLSLLLHVSFMWTWEGGDRDYPGGVGISPGDHKSMSLDASYHKEQQYIA